LFDIPQFVMAGLDPAINVFNGDAARTWMAGTSPAMTNSNSFDTPTPLRFFRHRLTCNHLVAYYQNHG